MRLRITNKVTISENGSVTGEQDIHAYTDYFGMLPPYTLPQIQEIWSDRKGGLPAIAKLETEHPEFVNALRAGLQRLRDQIPYEESYQDYKLHAA